jgi:integrase
MNKVFVAYPTQAADGGAASRPGAHRRRAGSPADHPPRRLRHSAARSWLEQGVHIKAVSDLLGHSSIAITGDVYGHTSDDTARAAITGLAARLGL